MDDGALIWIVDDNEADVELTRRALAQALPDAMVEEFPDGRSVLSTLQQMSNGGQVRVPSLILLDLTMPVVSGWEVLDRIRSTAELDDVAIAVLTSSSSQEDVAESYRRGTNAFVTKPYDWGGYRDCVVGLLKFFGIGEKPA